MRNKFKSQSDHLAVIYDGAMSVLEDTKSPLKYSFCALALRELFREYLVNVAPDESISACSWWVPTDGKVTRKDRIRYMVFGGTSPDYFNQSYVDEVEKICSVYSKLINKLSRCLHVTEDVLSISESSQRELIDKVLETFSNALDLVDNFRDKLRDKLSTIINQTLDEEFILGNSFDEIDILSSHTRPTGVWDINVDISEINHNSILFLGTGTVECDLQYGSDGDYARGDGFAWEQSFPFRFKGIATATDPQKVEIERSNIEIEVPNYEH